METTGSSANVVEEVSGGTEDGAREVVVLDTIDGGGGGGGGGAVDTTDVASSVNTSLPVDESASDLQSNHLSADDGGDKTPSSAATNGDEDGAISSLKHQTKTSTQPPQSSPPQSTAALSPSSSIKYKFSYEPQSFEVQYYNRLFQHVASSFTSNNNTKQSNSNKRTILPPKEAANLFLTSKLPPSRLKMIWNMATMPSSSSMMKPPPGLSQPQFNVAVRLIQLLQNRVVAKDEMLNVDEDVLRGRRMEYAENNQWYDEDVVFGVDGLVPAYFVGVSGDVVPFPSTTDVGNSATNGNHKPEEIDNVYRSRSYHRRSTASASSTDSAKKHHRLFDNRRKTVDNPVSKARINGKQTMKTQEQQRQQQPNGNEIITYDDEDEYMMSQDEVFTYQEAFSRHCVTEPLSSTSFHSSSSQPEQHVYVDSAVSLFSKSGLDRNTLGQLWDVVVDDADAGKLNKVEFVLMTHLIVCVTRRGLAVPRVLPVPLRNWRENTVKEQRGGRNMVPSEHGQAPITNDDVRPSHQNQAQSREKHRREERMQVLEREICSLKKEVHFLRTELRELKVPMANKTGGTARGGGGSPDTTATSKSSKENYSKDDLPNVDVEMYWGQKQQELSPTMQVKMSPPSKVAASKGSMEMEPKQRKGVAVSQNIPSMHKSMIAIPQQRRQHATQQRSSLTSVDEKEEVAQSQNNPKTILETFMVSIKDAGHSLKNGNLNIGSSGGLSVETEGSRTGRNGNTTTSSLRRDNRDPIQASMRSAIGRMESDAASNSSPLQSNEQKSAYYVPLRAGQAQHKSLRTSQITTALSSSRRPPALKSSIAVSSRHVVRTKFGHEMAYKKQEVEPPSTKAVDLKPLSPPPLPHADSNVNEGTTQSRKTGRKKTFMSVRRKSGDETSLVK